MFDHGKKYLNSRRFAMRAEQEMFDLILNMAKKDDRVHAVIMNGSTINPNAIFQYNTTESTNSYKFLKDVYLLPKDAKEIY
jgi:hypothetical protein